MRALKSLAVISVFLAVVPVSSPASAAGCPRPCTTPNFNCADAAVTETDLQIGGEGAVFTELSCGENDGTLENVEGDAHFKYERGVPCGNAAACGRLTLTITNATTCPGTIAKITRIWFSTPSSITGGTLTKAIIDGSDLTTSWELKSPGQGAGCFGQFDWKLSTKQGINGSIHAGKTGVFTVEFSGSGMGSVTACDIADEVSQTSSTGQVATHMVLHFQNTNDQPGSDKTSSNCTPPQLVELASFDVTPTDAAVRLDWSTAVEVDNAGFYLLRRDTLTGRTVRLNAGLIPAQGDVFEGANYSYTDRTAINGVRYQYILVDVDLEGREGFHPSEAVVPNPERPPIRLLFPSYGSHVFEPGSRIQFRFEPALLRGGVLEISSDPTFRPGRATVRVPLTSKGARSGEVVLGPAQTRAVELLAANNGGSFYWRIVERTLNGRLLSSPTYLVGYETVPAVASGPGLVLGPQGR